MKTSSRLTDATMLAAVVAATFIAYSPVFSAGFVRFDDPEYFTENERILAGLSAQGIRWALTADVGVHWHPLTVLSLMLDVTLFGRGAFAPHLVNLVLHALNTLLLFFVLRAFTRKSMPSIVVAALFALHPLHVESVAWVAARKDVLSLFFTLLAMLAYARYAQRRTVAWMVLVFVLFACGLMSKPTVVVLPFLLLLLDFWPLARVPSVGWGRLIVEKVPLLVLSVLSTVITLVVQRRAGTVVSTETLPPSMRLTHALIVYMQYLAATIWPLNLAFYYPYVRRLQLGVALACVVPLVGATWLAWSYRRTKPFFLVGWLWYLGALVPVIGLVQSAGQARADRYTYIPLIGVFIAATWAAAESGFATVRRLLPVVVTAVFIACSVLTYRQVGTWHDTVTLANHALAVDPNTGFAHSLLGTELMHQGALDEAIRELRESLRLGTTPEDESNLGVALVSKGDPTSAVTHLQRAAALAPADAKVRYNLGHAFMLLQRYEEAIPELMQAIQLKPDYGEAHYDLAVALMARNDIAGAIREFRTTLTLTKNRPDAHAMLGSLLRAQGDIAGAIEQYRESLRAQPDDAELMHTLAWVEATHPDASIRNGPDAVRLEERALELTVGRTPAVLIGLAAAYAEVGRYADAVATIERVMALARDAGQHEELARLESLLQLFKSKQPFRQP